MKSLLYRVLTVMCALTLSAGFLGCDSNSSATDSDGKVTHTETEVNDKLLGGTEVKEKQVIEKDGKAVVKETETEYDDEGNVTEKEVKIKGDTEE